MVPFFLEIRDETYVQTVIRHQDQLRKLSSIYTFHQRDGQNDGHDCDKVVEKCRTGYKILSVSDEASLRCAQSGDRRVISTLEAQYVRPNGIHCDI